MKSFQHSGFYLYLPTIYSKLSNVFGSESTRFQTSSIETFEALGLIEDSIKSI